MGRIGGKVWESGVAQFAHSHIETSTVGAPQSPKAGGGMKRRGGSVPKSGGRLIRRLELSKSPKTSAPGNTEHSPNVTPVYFYASFSQAFNKSFAQRVVTADSRCDPRILLA